MSFLSGLFKKKPGGTFFGNLLRGVASSVPVVGGTILGTGANKIELGQTKTNAELAKEATGFASGVGSPQNPIQLNEVQVTGQAPAQLSNQVASTISGGFKDSTIVGKLLGQIRGELKATTDAVQPKVGIATETMLIAAGAALLGILMITQNKK